MPLEVFESTNIEDRMAAVESEPSTVMPQK